MFASAVQTSLYASPSRVFLPLGFAVPIAVTLICERLIRRHLDLQNAVLATSSALTQEVQRRLPNEPFFQLGLNALVWLCAAITYSLYFLKLGMDGKYILDVLTRNPQVGRSLPICTISHRLSYALVGDTVNLASRLQDANKRHATSIIVSAETRHRLSRQFPLRPLPTTVLKGKREAVELYGL